jgi:type VI secretion system protein VasJ
MPFIADEADEADEAEEADEADEAEEADEADEKVLMVVVSGEEGNAQAGSPATRSASAYFAVCGAAAPG